MTTRTRADSQLSAMAGEFLTAGKLFKRDYQVAITLGNAKAIDLFVFNSKTNRTLNVQVKTLRKKNCFPIKKEKVQKDSIYVFIILNDKASEEDFFIVKGSTLLKDVNKFWGASYQKKHLKFFPAINYGPLKDFKDNWDLFDK